MWHVVLPGTPEHRNTEHRNIPEHHGTPPPPKKNPEHPQENQEHPQENPRTPPKNPKSQKADRAQILVTARVISFSKLPPLIAHKII